ncbi:DnaD domain protein [Mesobacillus maritimus]|uniref:DnaD domain protein n=1 Tax=Mesobacillus maritimus TaxID=1643336 RepID=UPI00384B4577
MRIFQPKAVMLNAMKIACADNKRRLNYIVGILRPWENESLLTRTDMREDVCPWILCNEECIGRIASRLTKLGCAVNIQACNEAQYKIKRSASPKKGVVVGGGPTGIEAARVAALKGHTVNLS